MPSVKKVLIVGGGIAGPALGIFLSQRGDFDITLIEKQKDWKTLGFGVNIWGIGRRMLRELGIEKQVVKEGYAVKQTLFHYSDGTVLNDVSFKQFENYGGAEMIIPRDHLHQHLIKAFKKTKPRILMNTTIESAVQTDSLVKVGFSNNKTEEFDLVVAADGIHSQLRDLSCNHQREQRDGWTIELCYLPKSVPAIKETTYVTHEKQFLAVFPMKTKSFVAIYSHDSIQKIKDIMVFLPAMKQKGWNKKHLSTLARMKKQRTRLAHVPPGNWYNNRIALVGDSRHAVAPTLGLGCTLAMEDAYVLATELTNTPSVSQALQNYAKRREKRINHARKMEVFADYFAIFKTHPQYKWRHFLSKVLPRKSFPLMLKLFFKQEI